ncbi:hypothetical protein CRG98_027834 [Punica granatum]|uniref:Uncharacterized protein n=1 Tax=Punica granatum TaxID=22663 RepID=A0A2I0J7Y1_PUNGR|nr:hypothetical protein CRG98_027834 [Punica granatum]
MPVLDVVELSSHYVALCQNGVLTALQAELASLRAKRDDLRQEIAKKDEQLVDQRQLQKELAQALVELQRRDQELAWVNAALERSRKRIRVGQSTIPIHSQPPATQVAPPPVYAQPPLATQAPPPTHNAVRVAALVGNFTTLQGTVDLMAANMAEMVALLRGPNRTSSSSTPPLAHGSTVDPAPWASQTHVPDSDVEVVPAPTVTPAPILPSMHVPAIHPVNIFQLPSTVMPMTTPVPGLTMFALPPMSVLILATIYIVPPSMGFLASSAPPPTQTTEPLPFSTLQPHISFPYQAPPPINFTFPEPGTLTHAAPVAPPTNFLPET